MSEYQSIMEAAEDDLLEVSLTAGRKALARVVAIDRSGDGSLTLRIEPGEAKYRRDAESDEVP